MTMPDPERLPFIRTVDMGGDESRGIGRYPPQEGAFYPALVSAVDADGNELAGIRLPEVSVPVGTHAGWNPRDPSNGAPEQIVSMDGFTMFFPSQAGTADPRPSLAQRYAGEAQYLDRVREAAEALVAQRYLLAEDVERVVDGAAARYRAAVAGATSEQAVAAASLEMG